jgi:four helix bundle protein
VKGEGGSVRDHRKLRAFELADEVAVMVYRETSAFPNHELYGLTSQMRRATVSAASNIVEGCARGSQGDYVRFLEIAFGSTRELRYQCGLARRLGFFADNDTSTLEQKLVESEKVLNALIRSVRRLKAKGGKAEG